MRAIDGATFKNIAATSAPFTLLGGRYGIGASGTFGGGSITLELLLPDGATYVPVMTAFSAAGYVVADIPNGTYQFVIVTATAVYAFVERIPVGE